MEPHYNAAGSLQPTTYKQVKRKSDVRTGKGDGTVHTIRITNKMNEKRKTQKLHF
jgi:hypothetical protein